MQAVGENVERDMLDMLHVGLMQFRKNKKIKKSTDSGGRDLETCYEKMRRWLTVGCQLGCLAKTNGSTVTHWFLSLPCHPSSSFYASSCLATEQSSEPISCSTPASYSQAMISFCARTHSKRCTTRLLLKTSIAVSSLMTVERILRHWFCFLFFHLTARTGHSGVLHGFDLAPFKSLQLFRVWRISAL